MPPRATSRKRERVDATQPPKQDAKKEKKTRTRGKEKEKVEKEQGQKKVDRAKGKKKVDKEQGKNKKQVKQVLKECENLMESNGRMASEDGCEDNGGEGMAADTSPSAPSPTPLPPDAVKTMFAHEDARYYPNVQLVYGIDRELERNIQDLLARRKRRGDEPDPECDRLQKGTAPDGDFMSGAGGLSLRRSQYDWEPVEGNLDIECSLGRASCWDDESAD